MPFSRLDDVASNCELGKGDCSGQNVLFDLKVQHSDANDFIDATCLYKSCIKVVFADF